MYRLCSLNNLAKGDVGRMSEIWHPLVAGADGVEWFEPLRLLINWKSAGLEIKQYKSKQTGREAFVLASEFLFFRKGVTFSKIGSKFSGRSYRFASVFCDASSSLFPENLGQFVCLLNSQMARNILQSLNPTVNFQTGDLNRLPAYTIPNADSIFATIDSAFTTHESHREPSVEFKSPGPSPWRHAQQWAQRSVDRPEGVPLPHYEPGCDQPEPVAFVSFAIGVALGRFGAQGEGILDLTPASALPGGVLFVSPEGHDSVEHPACVPLLSAWKEHGAAVGAGRELREYLTDGFFSHHKKLYENRPIYFPLSSAKKGYVAFVSIHRWQNDTLNVLLADHLVPEKRRLEGELEDIRKERVQSTAKGKLDGKVEKRYGQAQKLLEEITDFIAKVTQVAECGPPAPDDKTKPREVDARFVMDLDDGVMVNSAALWPLLEPQWKDPKKWWKELATAVGRKDYDWAHLSARYFSARVEAKCKDDPSLAVAHRCFWRLHPQRAYAWELRLQGEIGPTFTIDEPGSDEARAQFLDHHPEDAAQLRATEEKRREREAGKAGEDDTPLLDQADDAESEESDA